MSKRVYKTEAEREEVRARIAALIKSEDLSNTQLKARGYPYSLIHEVRVRLKHRSPYQGEELLQDADMAEAKPPYQTRQFVRTDGGEVDEDKAQGKERANGRN